MQIKEKQIIELTDEIRSLLFQRDNFLQMNQPVPEDLEKKINSKLHFTGDTIDQCVSFIKMSESQIEWLQKEIDFIKLQQDKYQRAIDSVKDAAKMIMEREGILKMEGSLGHSLSIRRSEVVEITDMSKIPDRLKRQKISIEPDKVAIKALIKEQGQVDGARISESKWIKVD
jgi:hypothetical protein